MAKQSSVNLDITNNADGFDISGGTTSRKLGVTGGDVTIAGSGSAVVTFPTTSTTIAGLGIAQSFTALQTFSAGISASGATFSGPIQIPINTAPAITIGNDATRNLTLSSITRAGEIVQTGTSNATLNIRQESGGVVSIGDYAENLNSTFISVDDSNTVISLNGPGCSIGLYTNGIQIYGTITNPLTLASTLSAAGATFSGNISAPNIVSSFNGATGAVTGITAGGVNTFTQLNSFSVGISAAGATFSGPIISTGYQISSGAINAQIASYGLTGSDNGKIVTMNVATPNTLTVPAGLGVGFNCTAIQLGAGQTTITTSAGVTLNSYQGYLKISGQHGSASIVGYTSNVYNVAGNLSA